jgi:hypothetical protein
MRWKARSIVSDFYSLSNLIANGPRGASKLSRQKDQALQKVFKQLGFNSRRGVAENLHRLVQLFDLKRLL